MTCFRLIVGACVAAALVASAGLARAQSASAPVATSVVGNTHTPAEGVKTKHGQNRTGRSRQRSVPARHPAAPP